MSISRGGLGALAFAAILMLPAAPALATDTDGDGLRDAFELRYGVTDPGLADTDGDGVVDSAEDNDGDHLGNLGEQHWGTDPGMRDTDADGIPDGREDGNQDGRSNALQQDTRPLPVGLRPSLHDVSDDDQPDRERCQSRFGESWVRRCVFGKAGSSTTIVLFGDSHATMYLTAYKSIARANGWKLVTMTKAACAPFIGINGPNQRVVDGGRSCRRWRRNAIAWLQAHPPTYVVFDRAPRYKLQRVDGHYIPERRWPFVWQRSVERTLAQLPTRTRALVLGGVPYNRVNPVDCLRGHPRNISRCVTRAVPASKRPLDDALRRGALAAGAQYATLYDKICSYDPCPVIQGDVLMWRDGGHLTETFASRLAPSLARLLDRKLVHAAR